MGIYMSTLTQFLPQNPPAGIKSVQRGLITISSSNYTATATISSVNMTWLGSVGSASIDPYAANMARVELTDATTVTATRGINTGSATVSYEVVEFN
jgi:hypothetical protein